MIPFLALAAAGLLAAPSAAPAIPGEGDVSVSADSVTVDTVTGAMRLSGNVVLRRGLVTLRAREASYDRETGEVVASGGVLLADPTRVVAADGVRAVLGDGWEAREVVAFLKEGPSPVGDAVSIDEARRAGANRATVAGARLRADASGRLEVSGARVTLCDCGDRAPSWVLHARKADVIPGKRAILTWPVLRVTPRFLGVQKPVPVLTLPWLYVPLADRQTGLLFPAFGGTGSTGFGIAQPLFVTLGRSADLTLTPEWFFGPGDPDRAGGAVRGPGVELELRWALAPGAEGRLGAHWVHDLDDEPGGASGGRLQLGLDHRQPLGAAGRLVADVSLASDPVWYRDFSSDLLLRNAFYARSAVLASRSLDALVLEASAAYHEPLAPDLGAGRRALPPGVRYGPFGGDLPVFHRWPSLAAELVPVRLGPLLASGRAGLSRFAPIDGDVSDGGLDGLGPGDRQWGGPEAAPLFEGDGAWQERERLAVTRADARLELRAPIALAAGAIRLEPYLRGAATGYRFDSTLDDAGAAWAVFGAAGSVELERAWGDTVHRLVPRLEYRGGTAAAGSVPRLPAYDLWDRVPDERVLAASVSPGGPTVALPPRRFLSAAPDRAFHQLRLALDNRLARPGLGLRLELGQDLDLGAGRFAESFVSSTVTSGPFRLDGAARFLLFQDRAVPAEAPGHGSWLDAFTELRAGIQLSDRRGDSVHAALISVGPGGSGTAVAGVDPLFDLRPTSAGPISLGSAGVRGVLGGAAAGYDVLVPARGGVVERCDGSGTRPASGWQPQQHTFSLSWDSPCRCFGIRLQARMDACGELSGYQAVFDFSRLGERAALR